MKLIDVVGPHLPQRVGPMTIRWIHDRWASEMGPKLEGFTIFLPFQLQAEFIALQGGSQFVYLREVSYSRQGRHWQVLFGGMDDGGPFLVDLIEGAREVVAKVPQEGEEVFYAYLKPRGVRRLEADFGFKAERQGDIFAVPLPWSWDELDARMSGNDMQQIADRPTTWNIFGTRHILKGFHVVLSPSDRVRWVKKDFWEDLRQWQWNGALPIEGRIAVFATGVIEAPNHPPLTLEGLHALFRVEVLSVEAGAME